MTEELKPYLWNPKTGRVFCAYCGKSGFKPNPHGAKAKVITCFYCGAKHKNESIDTDKEVSL